MNAPATSAAFRILVIDDTPSIHEDFRKILVPWTASSLDSAQAALFGTPEPGARTVPFVFDCALQGQDGLSMIQAALAGGHPYALAFVDMRMPPGWDGIETIRQLWRVDPTLQVVICTAYSDHSWSDTVRQLGAANNFIILKKPFDNIEVLQLAHALTSKWQLARLNHDRLASLDETVRVRTHELYQAEECFAKAFNASPLPQAIIALDNREVLDVNAAFERTLQVERAQVVGRTAALSARSLDPASWSTLLDHLAVNEPVDDFAFVYPLALGLRRDLRCSSRPITIHGRPCSICVLRDVTEQLQLEQQYLQAQKMEAIGQLAAGVAHDFNNLLTIIQCYTDFVLDDRTLPTKHRARLDAVRSAGARAAELTRQLLAFSRRQITRPTSIDVALVIVSFRKMLSLLVPEPITLEVECAPGLPPIVADVANLEHVIMNLVVNARDALPQHGRIVVAASAVTLDATSARRHPNARPGHFVRLSVADNGTGIKPELLPRIFEPFFTTKDVGKGTGLGLSTVYGIVQQHNGWIEVTSTVGQGTTFELFFPVLEGAVELADASADGSSVPASLRGHGERILVVEDDPAVRLVVHTMVTQAGYDVIEAVDGPSAIAAWEAAGHHFDLLFTDVVMPNDCNGVELAQRFRRDAPALKIVLTTGYSEELLNWDRGLLGNVPIVLKPFTADSIMRQIRATLDAPVAPAPASG